MPKSVSKITTSVTAKNCPEFSKTDLIVALPSVTFDTRVCGLNVTTDKKFSKKKNTRNDSSRVSENEKNRKKDLVKAKATSRQETRLIYKHDVKFDKRQNRFENNKANNINSVLQKEKIKSITSTTASSSKSIIAKQVKFSSSNLTQNSRNSKTESKTISFKKVGVTKTPERFSTNNVLADNHFVLDDNFDLADLIEVSLKNIRSPRSIFDYDFSCVRQTGLPKIASTIGNKIQNVDKLTKESKSIRDNIILNEFSSRITPTDEIVKEKFAEKSE